MSKTVDARQIKKALISVYNKDALIPFAQRLRQHGVEIISTGNTACALQKANIPVTEVSQITEFPEMLDGRVKTLHPKIHGGILARRDKTDHMQTLQEFSIPQIDLVVIHLYPFQEALSKSASHENLVELIDVGGPTMLRAAAKNYESVSVLCDDGDYESFLSKLDEGHGAIDLNTRKHLSAKVFAKTAEYDACIASYLKQVDPLHRNGVLDDAFTIHFQKQNDLRYGENPHQKSALYSAKLAGQVGLPQAKVLGGKELSYNNYLDLDAAWSIVSAYSESCSCVVKHNNPCGFAIHKDLSKAFQLAFSGDPLSAFGGIVGFNRKVDMRTAKAILAAGFLECIVATGYEKEALTLLKKKKNLRLVQLPKKKFKKEWDFKKISGGLLIQESNLKEAQVKSLKVATKKKPTKAQMDDLMCGFRLLRFIKSNAIVLMKNKVAVGIGMGQPSRVDSVKSALKKAGARTKGAVLASDGFFPKPDSIQAAAKQGVQSVIQPGGSIQDKHVIEACNKSRLSMVFTGVRHFSH